MCARVAAVPDVRLVAGLGWRELIDSLGPFFMAPYTPLIPLAVAHYLCVSLREILGLVESLFCLAGNQLHLLAHPLLAVCRRLQDWLGDRYLLGKS